MGKIKIIKRNALHERQPPTTKENPVRAEKTKTVSTISAWVREFERRRGKNPPSFAKLFTTD